MNVSFIVGERPFRLRVKGRWLRGSVGTLAARVLAAHGGGLRVEDCCLRLDGAPVAPDAAADGALRDACVVEVYRARVVVATLLTGDFGPIFELWHARFSRATDGRCALAVCCLDAAAERVARDVAARAGRPVRVLGAADGFRPAADRRDLWTQRLAFVARLVAEEAAGGGRDVVHSDCDAFWLGDARALVDGGAAPARFSVDHGLGRGAKPFALCCGFFRLRASAASLALLATWREATDRVGDDQVAVNALYDRDDRNFDLAPYERVQRCNCHHATTANPLVWHPWLDATVDDKVYVWGAVLARLDAGDAGLLRAFYGAKPDVALTRAALDGLLAAGA